MPGLPVHQLLEPIQTHVHRVGDATPQTRLFTGFSEIQVLSTLLPSRSHPTPPISPVTLVFFPGPSLILTPLPPLFLTCDLVTRSQHPEPAPRP